MAIAIAMSQASRAPLSQPELDEPVRMPSIDNNADVHSTLELVINHIAERFPEVLIQAWLPAKGAERSQDGTCSTEDDSSLLSTDASPYRVGGKKGLSTFRAQSAGFKFSLAATEGMPGRVWKSGMYEWSPNVQFYDSGTYLRRNIAQKCHVKGTLFAPLFRADGYGRLGVLEVATTSDHLSFQNDILHIFSILHASQFTICRPEEVKPSVSAALADIFHMLDTLRQRSAAEIKSMCASVPCRVHFSSGEFSLKGEDRTLVAPHEAFTINGRSRSLSCFGVFDGHGGAACAAFAQANMLPAVRDALVNAGEGDDEDGDDTAVLNALVNGFHSVDAAFVQSGDVVVVDLFPELGEPWPDNACPLPKSKKKGTFLTRLRGKGKEKESTADGSTQWNLHKSEEALVRSDQRVCPRVSTMQVGGVMCTECGILRLVEDMDFSHHSCGQNSFCRVHPQSQIILSPQQVSMVSRGEIKLAELIARHKAVIGGTKFK
eukprot:jgi/Mesvir1/15180/Mv25033-RA.3